MVLFSCWQEDMHTSGQPETLKSMAWAQKSTLSQFSAHKHLSLELHKVPSSRFLQPISLSFFSPLFLGGD